MLAEGIASTSFLLWLGALFTLAGSVLFVITSPAVDRGIATAWRELKRRHRYTGRHWRSVS